MSSKARVMKIAREAERQRCLAFAEDLHFLIVRSTNERERRRFRKLVQEYERRARNVRIS